ncbi:tyrosine-protein kinase STYK1b isoform X2 [Denticeps clupeoides]|nr:tyrosine-protein kinase STYK1-like isoform X2 [Denticeps clupeoides]
MLLRYCPEKVERLQPENRPRRSLHGIDAPVGINPLEHESIAMDLPSYSTFAPSSKSHSSGYSSDHLDSTFSISNGSFKNCGSYSGATNDSTSFSFSPRELPRQQLPEKFNRVSSLPASYSIKTNCAVSLYRARMDNRDVVLRVLNDSASAKERKSFLDFATFLSRLGPHPFFLELMGVVSLQAPLIIVMEEMENRDLLGFLWRCRQDSVSVDAVCEMTEKRIFTMASQVACALEYLHSKDLLHGNIKARSVLISRQLTAKLWGLAGVYARMTQGANHEDDLGKKKWQAPEVLTKRPHTEKSDVWSFGIMLYEMVTLGEAPFAEIPVNELLQYHQRGKTLKKSPNCSNALYGIIKACCQWKEQDRASLTEVRKKLQSGEKSANDKIALHMPKPINIEHYLQEVGYGESNSYSVF